MISAIEFLNWSTVSNASQTTCLCLLSIFHPLMTILDSVPDYVTPPSRIPCSPVLEHTPLPTPTPEDDPEEDPEEDL
ncbi:hypothetical protein ACFX13_008157 [Malus domestica]|uniref:Uncharacterized protein n=1 Tax=Malus domestica TaxID=3750 RepID=A0A498ILK9_MALDO|nr:hypothetical protein DVH24_027125 [Malus domestica]